MLLKTVSLSTTLIFRKSYTCIKFTSARGNKEAKSMDKRLGPPLSWCPFIHPEFPLPLFFITPGHVCFELDWCRTQLGARIWAKTHPLIQHEWFFHSRDTKFIVHCYLFVLYFSLFSFFCYLIVKKKKP